MKPFFGGIFLIFMLSLNEINTTGDLEKLKTKYTAEPAEPDDQAPGEDHRETLVLGTSARPKEPNSLRSRWKGFELPQHVDKTGESAYKLFLRHYEQKGIPNAPEVTLDLYNERHASGSYRLPEEKFAHHKEHRYAVARKRAGEPLVKPEHQQMYQQHQDFLDHSRNSAASLRGAKRRYENVEDQSGGAGSGSGYNHPATAPPMSLLENVNPSHIPPPEDLDFEEKNLQNNPYVTDRINNNNKQVKSKHGDSERGYNSA